MHKNGEGSNLSYKYIWIWYKLLDIEQKWREYKQTNIAERLVDANVLR